MDNKLSELSKPVAYTDADELRFNHAKSDMWPVPLGFGRDTPLYSQEYVSALLADNEAKDKRIAELETIRADASQVFKEIGNELGCNPDNESIMMAIDELKATQVTGPLAMIIKRTGELERILDGVTPEMIAGGWTAKGISDYAKSLESKLATPVRLPQRKATAASGYGDGYLVDSAGGDCFDRDDVIEALREQGFIVEGGVSSHGIF